MSPLMLIGKPVQFFINIRQQPLQLGRVLNPVLGFAKDNAQHAVLFA